MYLLKVFKNPLVPIDIISPGGGGGIRVVLTLIITEQGVMMLESVLHCGDSGNNIVTPPQITCDTGSHLPLPRTVATILSLLRIRFKMVYWTRK